MTTTSSDQGPFSPTWESLRQFDCPEWFRDAKLGIWSHWGPQVVPMYGDWYAQNMYKEGSDQYRYHLRTYGHPSAVGYKDIVKLWKAERFDPEQLMSRYVAAGAKYFVAQAAHHDNFHNWRSRFHPWNAVQVGPQKDIVGLWGAAARSQGLRFGLSEHMGATFSWWVANKGADATGRWAGIPYDGNDPAYEDLYLPNRGEKGWQEEWYTANPWWHERWLTYITDVIEQYQPDLLYSDGPVPFDTVGLRAIARLHNTSAAQHGGHSEAVYTHKDKNEVLGIFDIERSQLPEIAPSPWQTDTCVGHWFYDVRATYKTPKQVIDILVDVVSKNGNLLLNLPQRPDGTLDEECDYILDRLAQWTSVNGEGIFGTRPWTVAIEGPSRVVIDQFKEDPVVWSIEDFRFTTKDDRVYAFQMKWPDGGKTVIRSLAHGLVRPIAAVALLGSEAEIAFEQTPRGLAITVPERKPCDEVQCFRISFS